LAKPSFQSWLTIFVASSGIEAAICGTIAIDRMVFLSGISSTSSLSVLAKTFKHHEIARFSEAHGVNIRWLLEGQGRIFNSGAPS
jgi:hypothetical protein